MKNYFMLTVALMIGVSAFSAEPGLDLRGIMVAADGTKFSLVDKTNDTTRWVALGQSFAGFKVTGYDAATETVTVTKDGVQTRLRLISSRIKEGPAIPATGSFVQVIAGPGAQPEIVQAIRNNLRQISAAADQYFLENGKNTVPLVELVGPTKYIKQLVPIDGESYAGMQLRSGTPISVTTARGVNVSYAP